MTIDVTDETQLFDAIDGFIAWDKGARSSGISDPILRRQVEEHLRYLNASGPAHGTVTAMYSKEFSALVGRYLYSLVFCQEAIRQGYGIEDAKEVISWFDEVIGLGPDRRMTR